MSDTPEQIVAASTERDLRPVSNDPGLWLAVAGNALAALREAGWSLVRLDDCEKTTFTTAAAYERIIKRGSYYLVPVGSGDTGGET